MARGTQARTPGVIHLISSLRIGGAERLLVSTMTAAADSAAIRPVVIVMNEAIDPGLMAELRGSGVPVYHLARREGHLHPRYLAAILRVIRTHDIEAIHAHNDGSLFWGMLAKLARPRLKLVYTQHEQGGALRIRGLSRLAYRAMVDMTVAISPFIVEETRAITGDRVTLIENGIDLRKFIRSPAYQTPGQPVHLVQVGRFAPVKGQDVLLRAVRLCLDRGLNIDCTLAGSVTDPAYYELVTSLIKELDLENHVRIQLDRTDVENLLSDMDIFVLSSRQEGFGIAIIEAMAANLPVVVPSVGGARDIVRHGDNGLLFEVGNPRDLADKLQHLIATPDLGAKFAAAGARTAARYDIRKTLEAKVALYRKLLSDGRRSLPVRASNGSQGVDAKALREMP